MSDWEESIDLDYHRLDDPDQKPLSLIEKVKEAVRESSSVFSDLFKSRKKETNKRIIFLPDNVKLSDIKDKTKRVTLSELADIYNGDQEDLERFLLVNKYPINSPFENLALELINYELRRSKKIMSAKLFSYLEYLLDMEVEGDLQKKKDDVQKKKDDVQKKKKDDLIEKVLKLWKLSLGNLIYKMKEDQNEYVTLDLIDKIIKWTAGKDLSDIPRKYDILITLAQKRGYKDVLSYFQEKRRQGS